MRLSHYARVTACVATFLVAAVLYLVISPAWPRSPQVINLRAQPSLSDFGLMNDLPWFNLYPYKVSGNALIILPNANRIEIAPRHVYIRPEEGSGKVGNLLIHLTPMTREEASRTMLWVAQEMAAPEEEQTKIRDWGRGHYRTKNGTDRCFVNLLETVPSQSIGVFHSFDQQKPWYVQLCFTWDGHWEKTEVKQNVP